MSLNLCRSLKVFFLALSLSIFATSQAKDFSLGGISEKWHGLDKTDKLIYTNIGAATAITAWGIANWDYFQRSPHLDSEGWFGENTKSGGADKIGHLYTGYVLNRSLSSLYQSWGYQDGKAKRYAAWSSFGLLSLMEVGDAFSASYGFSYEDFILNGLGSYIGYQLETRPELDRKIDLRIEYLPKRLSDVDIFTDYENSKYLLALKLDGFDSVQNELLKYLELHLGYYTRGYDDADEDKKRNLYLGVGLNVSRFMRNKSYNKTATFLNYYQIPKTDIQFKHTFN